MTKCDLLQAAVVVQSVAELWLGKTHRVAAASTLELAWHAIMGILGLFKHNGAQARGDSMSVIQVTVPVAKETYELGDALGSIIATIRQKASDGLKVEEIVAALTENTSKLITGVMGAELVMKEPQEDPQAFANAVGLFGSKVLGGFLAPVASPQSPPPSQL